MLTNALTGSEEKGIFGQTGDVIDELSKYVHNFYKDVAPDDQIFENTETIASVVMISKAASDLSKGLPKFLSQLKGNKGTISEKLKGALNNLKVSSIM